MTEHHPLAVWLYHFSFAKYDLAKFGCVMKQKGLIFINFYVFGLKLLGYIFSVTVWQNQAVSISVHYTMVHHNKE